MGPRNEAYKGRDGASWLADLPLPKLHRYRYSRVDWLQSPLIYFAMVDWELREDEGYQTEHDES